MAEHNEWFFPRGALGDHGWESVVGDGIDGWQHTGLRVAELAGDTVELPAGDVERIVVPLAGAFTVEHENLKDLPKACPGITPPTPPTPEKPPAMPTPASPTPPPT